MNYDATRHICSNGPKQTLDAAIAFARTIPALQNTGRNALRVICPKCSKPFQPT